ncbi:MAG: hypothetical protein IJ806_06195 [Ruminococcus sp.]|nr:hypothetical protein [Ruminococcus sp.]
MKNMFKRMLAWLATAAIAVGAAGAAYADGNGDVKANDGAETASVVEEAAAQSVFTGSADENPSTGTALGLGMIVIMGGSVIVAKKKKS